MEQLNCYKVSYKKCNDEKIRLVLMNELGSLLEKRDDIAVLKSNLSLQPRQV